MAVLLELHGVFEAHQNRIANRWMGEDGAHAIFGYGEQARDGVQNEQEPCRDEQVCRQDWGLNFWALMLVVPAGR